LPLAASLEICTRGQLDWIGELNRGGGWRAQLWAPARCVAVAEERSCERIGSAQFMACRRKEKNFRTLETLLGNLLGIPTCVCQGSCTYIGVVSTYLKQAIIHISSNLFLFIFLLPPTSFSLPVSAFSISSYWWRYLAGWHDNLLSSSIL
jgi:hypothetical protein